MRAELNRAKAAGQIVTWFKPDAVYVTHRGGVVFVEVKAAAPFNAPPFGGQGLDDRQANNYMVAHRQAGVPTRFGVYESTVTRAAWLHELDAGRKHVTQGTFKEPRRVYPLTGFRAAPAGTDLLVPVRFTLPGMRDAA